MMIRVCLIVAILLCLLPGIQAQDNDLPFPIAAASAHPRLLLTDDYIEQTLIPRAEDNTLAWQNLLAYVNSSMPERDLARQPEQVTRSLAVAYLVTGDPAYADRAKVGLLRMVQEIAAHPAIVSGENWDSVFVDRLTGIAIGYDWLYEYLTPSDREQLKQIMLQAAELLNDPERDSGRVYLPTGEGTFRFAAFDHDGLQVIWAVTAVGLALYGEDIRAAQLLEYTRDLFANWIIPALDAQPGGAWAEGVMYGFLAHWSTVQMATAWWTAQGENFFNNSDWWYDRMAYHIYLRYPAIQHTANDPDGLAFWGYPAIIGDSARYSDAALFGRAQDLLLSTIYRGTEYGDWMDWFLAQGDDQAMLQGWAAVEEFLWRDESNEGIPPPWLFWYTAGTGHIFMRSNWLNDAGDIDTEATLITFNAGDRYSAHQLYDQGNITIWRAGSDLAVRSGVYSGTGDSDSDANYYARTVAANTLLICDIAENFENIRPNRVREGWLNDCGQRAVVPNTAINPYYFADNRATYETGSILRYAEEGSLNYFRADLTAAYNSTAIVSAGNRPKVSEVMREFVYIRPGTLVVYDRIITTQADFVPFNLLHTNVAPIEEGNWLRVDGGDSRLYFAGIAPQNIWETVEGYELAGEVIQFVENAYEEEPYGNYRVQFVPTQSGTNHFFLTLLIAESETDGTPPGWTYVQGDSIVGVAWGEWQVMFDDDAGNLTGASFQVAPGVANVLMTGLAPLGGYRVTLPNGAQTDLLADSAGTLYIFTEAAGVLQLQQR